MAEENKKCEFCGIEFDPSETLEEYKAGISRPNTISKHECEGMKPDHVDVGPKFFACSCQGKGRAQCKWIQDEVRRILDIKDDKFWMSNIVYGLLEFNANITSIWADQWCQVNATSEELDDDDENDDENDDEDAKDVKTNNSFETAIQCDSVEDGLAATYLCFYQRAIQKQKEKEKEKENEEKNQKDI